MWSQLLKKLTYLSKQDQSFVKRSFIFAKLAHKGQKRQSGEAYITHPYKVAQYLADYKFPKEVIAAGLLHDVLEDTNTNYQKLVKNFGKVVANLVDGVSAIGEVQNKANLELKNINEEKQYLRLQKLILASARDLRVIFIRLLDRKHNLETLKVFDKKRRQHKAKETLEIYAPLAKRIGMGKLSSELEDKAFAFLYPKIFKQTKAIQKEYAPINLAVIKKVSRRIKSILIKNHIKIVSIDYRLKHLYSLYNKLLRFEMDINQIYDLAALRIILKNKSDCYEALGLIHALYPPMIKRIKDYIANPKPNGYQSLHTTVFVKGKKPIEIQIRTVKMHNFAEHGLASHWLYKENAPMTKYQDWFSTLNKLFTKKNYAIDNVFTENIYLFTPKGEIIELPKNATALDFAYTIHSDIGHRAKHVLINGRIKPLDFKLRNSDLIEIKTSVNPHVSPLWLKKVETQQAKNKIRAFLRNKNKELKIKKAQLYLMKKVKFYGLNPESFELNKNKILQTLKINEEKFYLDIFEGTIKLENIIKRFFLPRPQKIDKLKTKSHPKVIVAGEKTIKIKIAKCCAPSGIDTIVGYVTNQKEITIHKKNCPELVRCDKTRIIPAWWEGERFELEIDAVDRLGLIFDITNVFKKINVNILDFNTLKNDRKIAKLKVAISRPDMLDLTQLSNQLAKIEGVKKIIFLK